MSDITLALLGNREAAKRLTDAVVPQQFYPVFRAIADIEGGVSFEHSLQHGLHGVHADAAG